MSCRPSGDSFAGITQKHCMTLCNLHPLAIRSATATPTALSDLMPCSRLRPLGPRPKTGGLHDGRRPRRSYVALIKSSFFEPSRARGIPIAPGRFVVTVAVLNPPTPCSSCKGIEGHSGRQPATAAGGGSLADLQHPSARPACHSGAPAEIHTQKASDLPTDCRVAAQR